MTYDIPFLFFQQKLIKKLTAFQNTRQNWKMEMKILFCKLKCKLKYKYKVQAPACGVSSTESVAAGGPRWEGGGRGHEPRDDVSGDAGRRDGPRFGGADQARAPYKVDRRKYTARTK